jgi:RNA polymerase sigma factor (sigma-70 family)
MGDMGTNSDTELVEASRRGERDAFGRLVARYQDVVCAVSYSKTGDWVLSEDVAQDTFIAAWRQLGQLRETGRIQPWLCGIARNLARKARKRTRREDTLDGEPIAASASPFDATAQAEAEQVVRDALSRVPDTYREALVLYYRENRSIRDVAKTLGVSEEAAMQRLSRGRRYLADGVTDLVERSLRSPRRNLVVGVLAAIGGLALPSRVDASPTKGSTMLKLALAASALLAAGTTAIVVHARSDASTPAPTAPPSSTPSPLTAIAAAAAPAPTPATRTPTLPHPPQVNGAFDHDQDDTKVLSRAELAKLHLDSGPSRGPADAPVTIVVFQDNLCPYCGRALGTLDQLMEEYPNKLRIIVKQFVVHQSARLSAEACYAADAQGNFWGMHDIIMAHQDDLSRDALIEYARQIGLDVARFTTALDRHEYAKQVADDMAVGKQVGVRGTPAFLINGRELPGAQPIEAFRALVDAALAD